MLYICMAMEGFFSREFTFPKSTMANYGFSRSTAMKSIDELIEAGFIRKVYSGKVTREPSKYEFVFDWKVKQPHQ